jgi:hypothetical protein
MRDTLGDFNDLEVLATFAEARRACAQSACCTDGQSRRSNRRRSSVIVLAPQDPILGLQDLPLHPQRLTRVLQPRDFAPQLRRRVSHDRRRNQGGVNIWTNRTHVTEPLSGGRSFGGIVRTCRHLAGAAGGDVRPPAG